ncbi:MAG: helix-turn-helix domain-containing protein [Acetobacteraceae bacterium]
MARTQTADTAPALQGLATMRDVLRHEVPGFGEAEAQARDADAFAAAVRADLRAHRRALGLDQTAFGARLGLSQSAISKIETGSGELGLGTVARYAEALGCRPVLLLRRTAGEGSEDRAAPGQAAGTLMASLTPLAVDALQDELLRHLSEWIPHALAKFVKTP